MGEASQADGNETSDPAVAVAFVTRLGLALGLGGWKADDSDDSDD